MQHPPILEDEPRRLAALREHQILDTPHEELFDAFARLAAQICAVPISLISLVDSDRQWFKANIGLDGVTETSREVSFCAHAIGHDGVLEVPDAAADERFADNPLVTGAPNIRFYAGAPLVTSDGLTLGSVCVIDRRPRTLDESQRRSLAALADAVMEQLEARRAMLRLFDSSQTELYHVDLAAGRIVFASEAARRNLGYDQREFANVPLDRLFPEFGDERRALRLGSLRELPDHRLTVRTTARRSDGSTYPIELRIELMVQSGRDIALVFGTDLTAETTAREQLDLLSAAIASTEDAVVIIKPVPGEGMPVVAYANDAFLRQVRGTADQIVGATVAPFLGPKTDMDVVREMRAKMMRGESARLEYVAYRLDGSHYYASVAARPMLDAEGKTAYFVVVEHDVTEQVLRGEQLEMQNERLTALTSIARGLFATLEPALLVEALLTGVRDLIGAKARILVARPNGGFAVTRNLSLPDRAPSAGDAFIEAASASDVTSVSDDERRAAIRIPGSLGQTRYVLDARSDTGLHTADVFALGLLGQYFAVAARNVELYHELQTRRAAVVELNQVKNDLIAMLAHDFKGPLTTIVGFADVLAEDDRFDEESRKFLNMISSSAMRLASLATDTLALSRLEQNELALTLEEFDLVGLAREVVRVFSVTRPIELRTDRPEIVIGGDPARLRQVLENLIGNAIKYSPGGEPVEVWLRSKGRGVEVSVKDHGIGIPEVDKPKLFGRFARAQNARAMGIGGTGFGLYLSKTIVEMHGGTIAVESKEGHGSTFRVFLPSSISAQRPKHRRFILIDPDGDARSYIAHTLRDDGGLATVVADGKELLDAIDETRFDAALVEVDRLGMPQAEFLHRVYGRTALIRIDPAPVKETQGWDGYLVRPFLVKDLLDVLEAAIAHQAKTQQALSLSSIPSA